MSLSEEEILSYLRKENLNNNQDLFEQANRIREDRVGDIVPLRAIIEFSNYCRRNCLYCGLRRSNSKLKRYRLTKEEVLKTAKAAKDMGYRTIVLQSGEDAFFTQAKITELIIKIKQETGLIITLSIGERPKADYKAWRRAGAGRYLLRHETANSTLYQSLHPDGSFEERVRCLEWLGELGYEVGSGFMVGLPGQRAEDIVLDLKLLQTLDVAMAGIGPFIPHNATPLASEKGGELPLALTTVALTRLSLPGINIPATTALGALDPEGRELALQCGANVVMPNATPLAYRELYQLYPGKICLGEEPAECVVCIDTKVKGLGRKTDLVKVGFDGRYS